jgi:hypothetical protein
MRSPVMIDNVMVVFVVVCCINSLSIVYEKVLIALVTGDAAIQVEERDDTVVVAEVVDLLRKVCTIVDCSPA